MLSALYPTRNGHAVVKVQRQDTACTLKRSCGKAAGIFYLKIEYAKRGGLA